MNAVMDAGALLALLKHERGGAYVAELLERPGVTHYVHAANACEVYYDLFRQDGENGAEHGIDLLVATGITFRDDMDPDFWRQAGIYKARFKRISLADCFGLALAARLGGEFVTTDHHEMDDIAQQGVCPIRFVR